MKFSLPSKSTLASLASIKKPPITSLLKVGAMMTPMGMVGVGAMTLGGLALTHKDEIKSRYLDKFNIYDFYFYFYFLFFYFYFPEIKI